MAEGAAVFGLITGVIGLLPLCVKGCNFIENVIESDRQVEEQLVRIQIQKGVLLAWGRVWEVPDQVPTGRVDFKLQRWIERNKEVASVVLRALAAISNLFSDSRTLQDKYGIRLSRRDPDLEDNLPYISFRDMTNLKDAQKAVDRRRRHMNIIKRCHFQLKGADKFDSLIERLREFIGALLQMCSETQATQIERPTSALVTSNINVESLQTISRVYDKEVERLRKEGQDFGSAELARDVAGFKARARQLIEKREYLAHKRQREQNFEPFLIDGGEFLQKEEYDLSKSEKQGLFLAIHKKRQKLHYIEWKKYGHEGKVIASAENDIMALSDFFSVENRPKAFRALPLHGILRDAAKARFGFVYRPPPYIENLGGSLPLTHEAFKLRAPKNLLEFIESKSALQDMWPLEQRFRLARQLAQCLYVLHAAGWVHKNLRPSSIAFLPFESTERGIPSRNGFKDTGTPYLCAFGHSRPDAPNDNKGFYKMPYHSWNITLDSYHHPRKQEDPSIRYNHAFDLYSLGIVLLEVGLWQPISSFTSPLSHDADHFRDELWKIAETRLRGQVGSIYARAVQACLNMRGDEDDEETQHILCWKVAAALDECNA